MTENDGNKKYGVENKKISDKQLKTEITENGKSYKEIAREYGYGFPSRALIRRIRNLGFQKANKVTVNEYGSATVSIPSEELQDAVSNCQGFSLESDDVFYTVRSNGSGDLLVELSGRPLVDKKGEVEEE